MKTLLKAALLFFICIVVSSSAFADALISTSGIGRAKIEYTKKKKEKPIKVREASAIAERNAIKDSIRQAVIKLFGNESKMGNNGKTVMENVTDRGVATLSSSEVKDIHIEGNEVVVTVSATISRDKLLSILENEGLSLTEEAEGKVKVYVLTYTVQGLDADRSKPIVLRDEVHDIRKNVHAGSQSSDVTKAGKSYSDKTSAKSSQKNASIDYKGEKQNLSAESASSAGHASAKAEAKNSNGRAYAKGEVNYDNRASSVNYSSGKASLNASSASSSSKYNHRIDAKSHYSRDKNASSHFSNTSSDYHSIKVYADPTKKGSGETNEVKAVLEGMLLKAGLQTYTVDINLMGQEFKNEDELVSVVKNKIEKEHPEIDPSAFVAVALNSTTPIIVDGGKKFTALINYRIFRLKDGFQLLPSKSLSSESDIEASEDLARAQATKLALARSQTVLHNDIITGIKRYKRETIRESKETSTVYKMMIKNASSPLKGLEIKRLLRKDGFEVKSTFRSKTIFLEIKLNGKTYDDILVSLENFLEKCTVDKMDENSAVVSLK